MSLAKARWGLEGRGNHYQALEHPFRVHVMNRSEGPVLFEARAADQHPANSALIGRQRDYLDISAAPGTEVRVRVQQLALQGPDVTTRTIEWTGEALQNLLVTVEADGSETRTQERSTHAHHREDRGMLNVASNHPLPIRVGWELEPGNGGISMPDERDREQACWLGTGVTGMFVGGVSVAEGRTARVRYSIPAVLKAHDFTLTVPEEGAVEVSVNRDGSVSCGPRTWSDRLVATFGF